MSEREIDLEVVHETSSPQPAEGLSRRSFLRAAGIGLAGAIIGSALLPDTASGQQGSEAEQEAQEERQVPDGVNINQDTPTGQPTPRADTTRTPDAFSFASELDSSDWPFTKTLAVTGGEFVATTAADTFFRQGLGFETVSASSHRTDRLLIDRPLAATVLAVGVAPPVEEGLFRLLPSTLADAALPKGRGSGRWISGAIISALFAYGHGVEGESGGIVLPVPSFIGGMALWFLQRRGGYKNAVLGHAIHNTVYVVSSLALSPSDADQPSPAPARERYNGGSPQPQHYRYGGEEWQSFEEYLQSLFDRR